MWHVWIGEERVCGTWDCPVLIAVVPRSGLYSNLEALGKQITWAIVRTISGFLTAGRAGRVSLFTYLLRSLALEICVLSYHIIIIHRFNYNIACFFSRDLTELPLHVFCFHFSVSALYLLRSALTCNVQHRSMFSWE